MKPHELRWSLHQNTPAEVRKMVAEDVRESREILKMSPEEAAEQAGLTLDAYLKFEKSGAGSFTTFLKVVGLFGRFEPFKEIFLKTPPILTLDDIDGGEG